MYEIPKEPLPPGTVTLREAVALSPELLDPLSAVAARQLQAEGESENTVRNYQGGLRYWAAWFMLRFNRPIALPVPAAAVVTFITDHLVRRSPEGAWVHDLPAELDHLLVQHRVKGTLGPLALSTVQNRIAILSKAHSLLKPEGAAPYPNPCATAEVRDLIAGAQRAYAKRPPDASKSPRLAMTADPLRRVIEVCDDSLRGVRDRALLLFAWSSGGRRRSEVAAAMVEDLVEHAPGQFTFILRRSKTNQGGASRPEDSKPVSGSAGHALRAWLDRSGIQEGPIFRAIGKGDRLKATALNPEAVGTILRARCEQAGLEGHFTAHSLRSGFVTEAGRQGVPMGDGMAMSGHRSVDVFMGYYRAADLLDSPAATLVDNPREK